MERVRPEVDTYLLDWLRRGLLKREWFFEQRDGNCRLMASLAVLLSETASLWARAVAPLAENISRVLWSTARKPTRWFAPATRLTQQRRSRSQDEPTLPHARVVHPPSVCQTCGGPVSVGRANCKVCATPLASKVMVKTAELGRIATHKPEAEALRAATMRRHEVAKRAWKPSSLPNWLNETVYREEVLPRLAGVTVAAIASALSVSIPYATDIRRGKRIPHPRHWQALASLVGLDGA